MCLCPVTHLPIPTQLCACVCGQVRNEELRNRWLASMFGAMTLRRTKAGVAAQLSLHKPKVLTAAPPRHHCTSWSHPLTAPWPHVFAVYLRRSAYVA